MNSYQLKGIIMSNIKKLYINDKEASDRYGYSREWFQRKRWDGTGPDYIKVNGGKVLYSIEKTDEWFSSFAQVNNR